MAGPGAQAEGICGFQNFHPVLTLGLAENRYKYHSSLQVVPPL